MSEFIKLGHNDGSAIIHSGGEGNIANGRDVILSAWCGGVSINLTITADEARRLAGALIESAAEADTIRAETVQQRLVA